MRSRKALLAVVILAALALLADGLWIKAKARLAQHLIALAWSQSVARAAPVKPWPWADTWPLARLEAPRQNAVRYVLADAHGAALAFGPGHLRGSSPPGAAGLSIVAGHRDTHFAFLRELRSGDLLLLTDPRGRRHRYRVTETTVVDSRIHAPPVGGGEDQLLLVTCYPFNALHPGGPLRYVVTARPVATQQEVLQL